MGKFLTVLLILIVAGMIFFNRSELSIAGEKVKDVVVSPGGLVPSCNETNASIALCVANPPVNDSLIKNNT